MEGGKRERGGGRRGEREGAVLSLVGTTVHSQLTGLDIEKL